LCAEQRSERLSSLGYTSKQHPTGQRARYSVNTAQWGRHLRVLTRDVGRPSARLEDPFGSALGS
jgi:hypothetical protein